MTMYRGPQFNTQMAKPAHQQKVLMVIMVLLVTMVIMVIMVMVVMVVPLLMRNYIYLAMVLAHAEDDFTEKKM